MAKRLLALMVVALCVLSTGTAYAVAYIDNFANTTLLGPPPVNGTSLHMSGTGPITINDAAAGAIGGSRAVTFGLVSGGAGEFVTGMVAGGMFKYTSSLNADSNVTLKYSANSPYNLSGASGIEISVMGFDYANSNPLPVKVTIDDGGVHSATQTLNSAGMFNLVFPFASFDNGGVGAPGTVNSVTIDFAANVAHDFNVGPILLNQQVVPEPFSILVWSIVGLVGAVYVRRNQFRAA